MKIKYLKTLLAMFFTLVGIGIIFYQQHYREEDLKQTVLVDDNFINLQTDITKLRYHILQDQYLLYYDNDIINQNLKSISNDINQLIKSNHLHKKIHRDILIKLLQIKQNFINLKQQIYRFYFLNASIKNSIVYLPTLINKAYVTFDLKNPKEKDTIILLSKIDNLVFLSKNAQDDSFQKELKRLLGQLDLAIKNNHQSDKNQILQIAYGHIKVFIKFFPDYYKLINSIQKNPIEKRIQQVYKIFKKETKNDEKNINNLSLIVLFLYIASILTILYLIFKSEKENVKLKQIHKELKKAYTTDVLTGLKNRLSYKKDRRKLKNPALILININRFKHINEFYGVKIGDFILKEVAKSLKKIVSNIDNISLYRIGGDDFGLLLENKDKEYAVNMVNKILMYFNSHTFEYQETYIDISVSVGISFDKKLLETADMALKVAKNSNRKYYCIYTPKLNNTKKLEKNIQEMRQLKKAISNDNIIPYFQPIWDNLNNKIEKYEILARLKDENGDILTPNFFLNAAKEAKLSGIITTTMLKSAFKILQEHDISLSVNISASDILDIGSKKEIITILKANRQFSNKIIFEILESEEIENYHDMKDFISMVKLFGCQISVDDFGSGYSSFEELLKLDIDFLKIDGTLIKNIDNDKQSQYIVEAIVNFAKNTNIKTVAEFVHSKTIFEKVKSMNIDYTQGYYIGRPLPNLL